CGGFRGGGGGGMELAIENPPVQRHSPYGRWMHTNRDHGHIGVGPASLFRAGFGEESGDKPDSVVGDHLSGTSIARRLERPTWNHGPGQPVPAWPCSGWGLPGHRSHLRCRWSLAPPFHPCRPDEPGGGLLSVALS